jgi:hypothetical protein
LNGAPLESLSYLAFVFSALSARNLHPINNFYFCVVHAQPIIMLKSWSECGSGEMSFRTFSLVILEWKDSAPISLVDLRATETNATILSVKGCRDGYLKILYEKGNTTGLLILRMSLRRAKFDKESWRSEAQQHRATMARLKPSDRCKMKTPNATAAYHLINSLANSIQRSHSQMRLERHADLARKVAVQSVPVPSEALSTGDGYVYNKESYI